MSEKPIIFNGDMVRAILRGDKTQTRRCVKPQPLEESNECCQVLTDTTHWIFCESDGEDSWRTTDEFKCPYGNVGDELWVRESFDIESFGAGVAQIRYEADNARGDNRGVSDRKLPDRLGGVPSIHMPRHCSRIQLRITDVRVERVQDITAADCLAEGIAGLDAYRTNILEQSAEWTKERIERMTIVQFKNLWDSINGKPRADGVDISWNANPYCWCISFERIA